MTKLGSFNFFAGFQIANISFRSLGFIRFDQLDSQNEISTIDSKSESKSLPCEHAYFSHNVSMTFESSIYIYMHTWYHTYALASNFFPSVFRANKLCPKISKLHFVESFRFCGFGHDFEVHRSGIRSSWGCKGCDVLNWSTKGAVSAKRVVDMSKRLLLFKGHCCFEEASSKIYKSKLFHDEMKNLIDSHESYHGTQSLGLISPSSQGPGVLWRLGPHP